MTDDPRVQQLLEELNDSDSTPEAVCKTCPELLPVVRKQWRRIRRLRADLDALFPPPDESTPLCERTDLPQVPGYEVEGVLGRGGMGIVFKARHLRLNRLVALKMALVGAYADPLDQARFQREAEAAAGLRHPNIVQVHDVAESNGRPYFTMEYIEGDSLAKRLAGTPQLPQQAAQILVILAGAVQAAHDSGIVHRDLKPANVLLTADDVPKISDFGLARRLEGEAGITRPGAAVGTPSYMAPEQALGGSEAVGPLADVYALGAILYELLTGRPPFRAATAAETVQQVISQEPAPPTRLNDKVPRDLETICLKCLQKEPERRYASAAALADDLLRFQQNEPILARRAGPAERLVKWTLRHRSLAALIVVGILFMNVLVGFGGWVLFERATLERAVSEDLELVVLAQKEKQWDQARSILERAKGRLGAGGSPELRRRTDQLQRELALVATLEEIMLSHMYRNSEMQARRTAARFESALSEAGLLDYSEDPPVVAERILATAISAPVLAALDAWADDMTGHVDGRQKWLLEVGQLVDGDPASRPIRKMKLWERKADLEAFAQKAPLANQSVPFLIFLAGKLQGHGDDPIPFLKRVQKEHVTSSMANATLANALLVSGNPAESIRYFQAAIALKPNHANVRNNIAKALGDLGRWEEALVEFEEARRLVPDSPLYNTNVGQSLNNLKRLKEAEREFRSVLESHADYAFCLTRLAHCLSDQGRYAEAVDACKRAIAADPNDSVVYKQLKECYVNLRRWDDARNAWKNWLAFNPPDHPAWDGYAELSLYLGDEAEYRRARTELLKRFGTTTDPRIAERTGRACLFLPASEDELRRATILIDLALASKVDLNWLRQYFRFAKSLAEYRAGNAGSALALLDGDVLRVLGPAPRLLLAMVQYRLGKKDAARESFRTAIAAYDWDVKKATDREAWIFHLLRREAETVLASVP